MSQLNQPVPSPNELDSGKLFSALTTLSEFGTPVKLLLINISLVLVGVLYKAVLYFLLPELDDKPG